VNRTAGRTGAGQLTTAGPETFEEFFRREHARLLRAMYLVVGSVDEADEVCQDAFVKIWERWERVGSLDDPTGYLYRTALNGWRSRYRRARRTLARVIAPSPPRDPFADADDRDEVVRALRGLAPRQRAALVLTELIGYGSEEAGELMGVRAVTVRVLASQGRSAIRSNVERDDE
jgi:RNA polymerase sigma-70 factor, ECF subfamily